MRPTPLIYRALLWQIRALAIAWSISSDLAAAEAADSHRGQFIFEKAFSAQATQSFNAHACVDCHRMGGVGGAGDWQFNARSIAIESLEVPANASNLQVSRFIGSLYPGFLVGNDGTFSTVATLPHFGGGPEEKIRKAELMGQLDGQRGTTGGPATHLDLRLELASHIRQDSETEFGPFSVTAKTFHRNTPALFGIGLIDTITDEQIEQQAILQRWETNISGRPATLSSGGIGRFGWRANVATLEEFVRQACENELGLLVESNQPRRGRLNSDMTKHGLQSLTAFLKSLPAPRPVRPTDPEQLQLVVRGEAMFKKIGCSVCHVQTVGLAENIYSDMLLHDMGESLRGPSTADPYIISSTEVITRSRVKSGRINGYNGGAVTIPAETDSIPSDARNRLAGGFSKSTGNRAMELVRPYQTLPDRVHFAHVHSQRNEADGQFLGATEKVMKNRVRVTNISQEWRTAPLWGLRDSAPYMHDGRAATVDDAIRCHEGEGEESRLRYESLSSSDQRAVLAFLATFAAPADAPQVKPPSVASTPADEVKPHYPWNLLLDSSLRPD